MRISQWTAGVAAVVLVGAVAAGVVSQLGPPSQPSIAALESAQPTTSGTAPPVVLPTDPFLGDRCALGTVSSVPGSVFALHRAPAGRSLGGNFYPTVPGYLLKLVNDSRRTAEVTGFTVTFYGPLGLPLNSDTEQWKAVKVLAPGQSLSWVEEAGGNLGGSHVVGGRASINPRATTCQLVSWTSPQFTRPAPTPSQP